MRAEMGLEPIVDRSKMFQTLITQANVTQASQASMSELAAKSNDPNATASNVSNGTKKGSGQNGTKTSSGSNAGKKTTLPSSGSKTPIAGSKAGNNKNTPTNQHGTKTSPSKLTNSLIEGLTIDFTHDLNTDLKDYVDYCRLSEIEVSNDVVIDMVEYGLKTFKVMIDESVDDSLSDKEGLVTNYVKEYKQFQDKLVKELIGLKDYSEMIVSIETSLTILKDNLRELLKNERRNI
jgi:cobalamin biosynthesis Mg chelatase CobN